MKTVVITSLLFLASCATRPTYDYASLRVAPGQGTVCKSISDQELNEFIEQMCKNNFNDECKDKLTAMIEARLKERYMGALPEAVKNTCARTPVKCKDPDYLEAVYLVNHNTVVDIFERSNRGWEEVDLQTDWRHFIARARNPAPLPQTVNHYHSTPAQQPVYQNPNVLPPAYRAPTHYQTNCQSYSWGTQCDTNGR